jgi:hypothetical protein
MLRAGRPGDIPPPPEDWGGVTPIEPPGGPVSNEDYPDYAALEYEPKFYEYFVSLMAARFAVRNTEQPRLHESLMQIAVMIKQDAIATTRSTAAAKKSGKPFMNMDNLDAFLGGAYDAPGQQPAYGTRERGR